MEIHSRRDSKGRNAGLVLQFPQDGLGIALDKLDVWGVPKDRIHNLVLARQTMPASA